MHMLLQSQTAEPLVFFMVSSTDGKTGITGITPTVTLSKNGGSFASAAGAVSEIGSGWYKVAGNATDSGTLGPLLLHATGTGADPADVRYQVVSLDLRTAIAQTGNAFTRLGAPAGASVSADVAAVAAKTGNLPADPADASDIAALFTTLNTLLTSTGIVLTASERSAIVAAAQSGGVTLTSAERAAVVAAVLTTQGTQSYRADGAAPTLMQALCEILAHLGEANITATTKTLKKFDGTTAAATYTLNSSTAPTSITRAS